jgi:hypothetical protein
LCSAGAVEPVVLVTDALAFFLDSIWQMVTLNPAD